MRRTVTQAFNISWSNAMAHSKDEPVPDGDIIIGRQTVTRVAIKSAATAENGDFAMVSTSVSYRNKDGLIELQRGAIEIIDRIGLAMAGRR